MATFEKRPNGWRVKIRKAGINRSESGFPTKAAAAAWAAKIEAEILAAKRGEIPDKTFGDLLRRYRDEVSPTKRGERWEVVRLDRIADGRPDDSPPVAPDPVAAVRLEELDATHIAAWRDRRLKEVGPASVLREWNLLSHACSVAVKEWRWLKHNPMQEVSRPASPPARDRVMSDGEVERILLACGYDYDASPETMQARVGACLLFALETAMRAGEICALTWGDIDTDRRVAKIRMSKNGTGRDVPLSKEAVRIINQLPRGDGPAFGMTPRLLDPLFRKARDRAMIEGMTFHDSRRTALTRLAAKVDVLTLAKISGHKDLRILQRVYYAPDMGEVAKRLD